jgi:hypothetical protein
MSSHPVSLFRQSLTQTLLLTLGLMLLGSSAGLIQGLSEPANEWGYRSFDLIRWALNSLSGSLIAALLALSLPWLLLSWFGEWLYTRALNRQDLFKLFWGEFIKFWTPLSLLLLALCSASQWIKYDSGREIPWELALFIPALSLFMALLFVANGDLLRQLLLPGIALLGWLLTGDGWGVLGLPVGHGLTLLAGAGLLFWLQRQLAQGLSDLSLEVPGRVDDEYQAMQRSWLFRSFNWLGAHSPLLLSPARGPWMARIKLLSGHPYMLYMQLLAIVGLLGFLLSLFLGRAALENLPMASALWILACALAGGCLLLLPVRLAGNSYWEFFRTRPLPRIWQYAVNWGVQSLFLLGLVALGQTLLWSMPEIAQNLNFANLATALLFLWLAGELGVGLLLLLLAFGFGTSPTLVPGAAVLLHSHDWPAIALWGTALAFRAWDIWRFQGHFWEPLALPRMRLLRLFGYYLPPVFAAFIVLVLGFKTQPLAGFVALNSGEGKFGISVREQQQLATKTLEVLYVKAGRRLYSEAPEDLWTASFTELSLLRDLVKQPHNADLAQQLAEKLFLTVATSESDGRAYNPPGQDHYQREYTAYYLAQGKYWLRFAPASDNLAYIKALMAEAQGDFIQAQANNAEALKAKPVRVEWLMQKARLESYLLRYAPALDTYTSIAQRFPEKSTLAWRAAHEIALESGQWDLALEYALQTLQAGYRPDSRGRYRSSSFESVLYVLTDYRTGLCPQLPSIMADFKQRNIAPAWLPQLARDVEWNCKQELKHLMADPKEYFRGSRADGLWLLEHGHPALAAQALTGHDNRGLKAEALWQAGKRSEALALAQAVATPWQALQGSVYYYSLSELYYSRSNSPEYLGHRILLRAAQPRGLDSGYQVLFMSRDPSQEWPLVEKAYAKAPTQLLHLQQLYQGYNTLAKAFAATGMTGVVERRSLKKLEMMVFLADTLPTELQTAELKAAVQTLRKRLYR